MAIVDVVQGGAQAQLRWFDLARGQMLSEFAARRVRVDTWRMWQSPVGAGPIELEPSWRKGFRQRRALSVTGRHGGKTAFVAEIGGIRDDTADLSTWDDSSREVTRITDLRSDGELERAVLPALGGTCPRVASPPALLHAAVEVGALTAFRRYRWEPEQANLSDWTAEFNDVALPAVDTRMELLVTRIGSGGEPPVLHLRATFMRHARLVCRMGLVLRWPEAL